MHVPEPWLSKYRGRYDDGYHALKARRAAAAKRLGLVPEDAALPGPHPLEREWASLSKEEKALEARGMEVYAGMVENMDYHLGRVVTFLEDIGEVDNTVILFLSDNGANPWYSEEYPGNRGSAWLASFDNGIDNIGHPGSNYSYGIGWASAGAGPLDRFKMTVSEGGIRSPLVMAGPGIEGGRLVTAFSYVTDIMPTILEMVGVEHPKAYGGREVAPLIGRSLTGVLSGTATEVHGADDLVGGEMGGGKWMRRGDHKAVQVPKPYGEGIWRLYDVVRDPGETHDLGTEMPDLLRELRAAWDRYAEDVGVVPAAP
jgi:arylsulfatase